MNLTAVLALGLFANMLQPGQAFGDHVPGSYRVMLSWDPNPPEELVVGYRLHYGTSSGNYTTSVTMGDVTSYVISGLESRVTYYMVVTAYNASGLESQTSNEVSFTPGLSGVNIVVSPTLQVIVTVRGLIGHRHRVEATSDFMAWTLIGEVTLGTNGTVSFIDTSATGFPMRFYRTTDITP